MKDRKDPEDCKDFEDPALRRAFHDEVHGPNLGGLGAMNRWEQEELLLMSGTRKQRKEIKARRKAREQAKNQNK